MGKQNKERQSRSREWILYTIGILVLLSGSNVAMRAQGVEDVYAIQSGTIVTVTQGIIENGIIVIRDGIIEAVGKNIAVPVEAEVIKADSLMIYPGMIDGHTEIAIRQPKKQDDQQRSSETQTAEADPRSIPCLLSPEKQAADILDPKDSKIAKVRETGITTVLTVPAQGVFIGQSVLINLNGNTADEMILKSPVGMHLGYTGQGSIYPSTLMAVIAFQRQTFLDALHHKLLLDRYEKEKRGWKRPLPDKSFDALLPVLNGEKLLIISANQENEIKRAIRLIDEFRLNALISGAVEGWRVKDLLQARQKPVLVSLNFPKPESVTGYSFQLKIEGPSRDEPKKPKGKTDKKAVPEKQKGDQSESDQEKEAEMKDLYANAGILHKAGIRFAFTSAGLKKPEDFIKNIAKTIEYGLPREVALRAVTIHPAEIFGVADQIGSIEAGKIANIIVATGDIFDKGTAVKYVFVDGKKTEIKEKKSAPGEKPSIDVTGTWNVTVMTPEGNQSATLIFIQSGSELSGEMKSEFGTGEIANGSVSVNTITFSVQLPLSEEPVAAGFTGIVEGNTIEGTIDLGEMGQLNWTAVKPGSFEIQS